MFFSCIAVATLASGARPNFSRNAVRTLFRLVCRDLHASQDYVRSSWLRGWSAVGVAAAGCGVGWFAFCSRLGCWGRGGRLGLLRVRTSAFAQSSKPSRSNAAQAHSARRCVSVKHAGNLFNRIGLFRLSMQGNGKSAVVKPSSKPK